MINCQATFDRLRALPSDRSILANALITSYRRFLSAIREALLCGADAHTHAHEAELSHEASQPQVIEARKEAERSEIAQRDDRTATRLNGMNEPTTGAERPNEHQSDHS